MVLEMIIRNSLSSQDVHILGDAEKTFYENLLKFLTQVKDIENQIETPMGFQMSEFEFQTFFVAVFIPPPFWYIVQNFPVF